MATGQKDFYDILVSCLSMNFKIGQLKSATPILMGGNYTDRFF